MRNNVIKGNEASNGGGIYITGSCSATITNNTIVDNEPNGNGGGIYIGNSDATIANNIIALSPTGSGIYKYGFGTSALWHNCVWSNSPYNYAGLPAGPFDTQQNPNLAGDNVHLTSSSANCIDKANAAYCVGSSDIDGDPRIIDGDGINGAQGDIGADEYTP